MQIISIYKFKNPKAADDALEALWRRLCGGFERSAGSEIDRAALFKGYEDIEWR